MTASAGRRHRSTLIATVVAVAATLAAAGLAVAGGLTIYNSTEGADGASRPPERVFPETPTALLAAVDGTGRLASLAVLVGSPSGAGGSIITVPVNADATSGEGAERLPVDETFQLEGVESLESEVEVALNMGLDVTEVVTADRLAAMLAAVGPIDVDLPAPVTGADGAVIAEQGVQTLDPGQAAAVLTARDPARPAGDQYPAVDAVWAGVAAAAGQAPPPTAGAGPLDAQLSALLAGPASQRPLSFTVAAPDANPRGVDVVVLDRAELALVFGQIAPGKMSAPNPALTFRVESPFDDAAAGGGSPADVVYEAVSQLLFVRGNVLSVNTTPGTVPAVTQVEVSDDSLLAEVRGLEGLFGPVEVSVAEEPIAGVDAVVRLGTSFVDFLAADDG